MRAAKHGGKNDIEALQAQIERLESNLGRALRRIDELESLVLQRNVHDTLTLDSTAQQHVSFVEKRPCDAFLALPPRQEVLLAAEKFLLTLNSVLPLFHPKSLLRCIDTWYENVDQQDCTIWAVVNVILALAHRQPVSEQSPPGKTAAYFLNNAQSVIENVIMGKAKLLNVQILLGMAMLYQATLDVKSASMLVTIALHMAHDLGLHSRKSTGHLDRSVILERDRVFWIAYILDRDLSMRNKKAPIQPQIDIDIEWPSAEPEDGAGLVPVTNGSATFNFLLSRVQLAKIQGEVYEMMYSMRAQALDNGERLQRTARLHCMLDDWIACVPSQFRPSTVLRVAHPSLCRAFGIIYSSHLACRLLVSQVHIMDSHWLQSLQDLNMKTAQENALLSSLPQGWQDLVHESREYMRLFMGIEEKDPAFIW